MATYSKKQSCIEHGVIRWSHLTCWMPEVSDKLAVENIDGAEEFDHLEKSMLREKIMGTHLQQNYDIRDSLIARFGC